MKHLSQRITFMVPTTTITFTADVSMDGWGNHCLELGSGTVLYSDFWTEHQLNINVLKLRAVHLTLLHLDQGILHHMIESGNMGRGTGLWASHWPL